jgi:cadmium resistance protein CadD (predicted permease)
MMEHFKPTGKKILGVIILLLTLSFLSFFMQFVANTSKIITGQIPVSIGFPLFYFTISSTSPNLNIVNLIIDIIIFYLVVSLLSLAFKGRRKENVPNSNSGGGNTSPPNQTQP